MLIKTEEGYRTRYEELYPDVVNSLNVEIVPKGYRLVAAKPASKELRLVQVMETVRSTSELSKQLDLLERDIRLIRNQIVQSTKGLRSFI